MSVTVFDHAKPKGDLEFHTVEELDGILKMLDLKTHQQSPIVLNAVRSWGLFNVSTGKYYFYAVGDAISVPFNPALYFTHQGTIFAFKCGSHKVKQQIQRFIRTLENELLSL